MTGMSPDARFQELLRELFQLDLADLDFGLYRLFRIKATEIEAFINDDIPNLVEAAFQSADQESADQAKADLEAASAEVRDSLDPNAILPDGSLDEQFTSSPAKFIRDLVRRYERARAAVDAIAATDHQKASVYNHLYAFFSRYYEDGDFIPRRRSGQAEEYVVPYRGEEVLFHWPTRGMHYVKTGEHFRDYRVAVEGVLGGPYAIRFQLCEATVPRDNAKGDRRFFFPRADGVEYDPDTRLVTIPFEYRPPTAEETEQHGTRNGVQRSILDAAHDPLVQAIGARVPLLTPGLTARGDDEAPTWLLRRLLHFTRRQTTDYFVFPGLKDFLERELEFYLKDVVLSLEDVRGDLTAKLRSITVIRQVGGRIIAFLDQIEQVQARLFEKRKLVLRTDWLVPIRHVPRAMWPQVLASREQVAAWIELFGAPEAVDEGFLETHPTLVVDTRHYPREFARALLEGLHETVGDIAEATDGLLVHAENFAALRTLGPTLEGAVKVIYIDPPYNTGNDGFIYKDRYQRATWLTMLEERVRLAREMLRSDGVFFSSIDDREQAPLKLVCESVFGTETERAVIAWQKRDTPAADAKSVSTTHEYLLMHAQGSAFERGLFPRTADQEAVYQNPDDDPRGPWTRASITRKEVREDRVFQVQSPAGTMIGPPPGTSWRTPRKKFEQLRDDNRLWWGRSGAGTPYLKKFLSEVQDGVVPVTWWDYRLAGSNRNAKNGLRDAFHTEIPFDTPKPTSLIQRVLQVGGDGWVLDYFAGSGTTAVACIERVRSVGLLGTTRFVLVEVAHHFDSALVPRLAKAMYAPDWKRGRPTEEPTVPNGLFTGEDALPDWMKRSPRLVKILHLESYDDAMHNLAASAERNGERADALRDLVGDDTYRLRYLFKLPLDAADTTLNLDKLERPFSYTLETLTDDGPEEVPVDMVETANIVLGVDVSRYETWAGPGDRPYLAVSGRRAGKRCLLLWRDLPGVDHVAERDFLLPRTEGYDEVLINGANATPGVQTIDPLLFAALEG